MDARLQPKVLRVAYSTGYFPMPDPETGEVVFLRPDPRAVIPLDGFHCSRSLHQQLRRRKFELSFDQEFEAVIHACADRPGKWITDDFIEAYGMLFELGMAHSIEVWKGETLAGGIYGVVLGGAFFAESKFHRITDASKVGLYYLVESLRATGFQLLEVQFLTPHLESLGAVGLPDLDYQHLLHKALRTSADFEKKKRWRPYWDEFRMP